MSVTETTRPAEPDVDGTGGLRRACNVCGHRIDRNDRTALVNMPCHVRAFKEERFNVWRCPDCRSIHCLEVVDLDHYYARYPFSSAPSNWAIQALYRVRARMLRRLGLPGDGRILDYGCGNGRFVRYLRRHGYANSVGFDPYAPFDKFGDPGVLENGPFDFIVLQDVLEHVEDPRPLLGKMDRLLRPEGQILIGTPNAANVDLTRPADFLNEIHVPYHLHMYTRPAVEEMGRDLGWILTDFFDRSYHDLMCPGLNARATNQYQRLRDGTMDVLFEPIQKAAALSSPKFIYFALFGYFLSFKADMTIVFRKNA
jgi:SAM-dependent methyltransferase